ncbi:MAG: Bug family tripartite tricarboxylate transporter substrate binding protein, partial [Xanthobacteraceae bacterium]
MDFGIRGIAPRLSVILMVVLAALIAPSAVSAQDYPSRPVKMIVPVPAGGITDVLARILQEPLTRKWGQPIVIDNRPGAGGNLGTEAAFKSDPDGYTVLFSIPGPFTVNPTLYQKLNFDPSEFVPVALLATIPTALIAGNKVPARTLPEFIAYARANPGKVTVATQGPATTSHLTSEWFQQVADVKFVTVPYRGSAPALQGMLTGDVDVMFDNLGVSLALVQAGKLKLLAVASSDRLPALPNVPTMAETLPGFEAVAWYGIVAPPKTPKNIVDKINADVNEALRQPQVQDQFKKLSAEIFGGPPDKASAYMRGEVDRWAAVI